MKQVVIVGNGIAGITAARYIRKRSDYAITVISGESEHFFSRTALMYLYMGHMEYHHIKPYEDWFWPKNRIELIQDWVLGVNTQEKELQLKEKGVISYDILLIASGSKVRKGGWHGEGAPNVQGLYSLQDLEKMEANTEGIKRAVVVGGGLIGVEMAEMLHSRKIPVTMLVREEGYWASVLPPEEARLINRHLGRHGIDLHTQTELEEIILDSAGRAKAVRTNRGDTIECQFVGIAIGVEPNTHFLQGSGIEIDKGVLVDGYFRTNIEDVYAIGDCAQYREPPSGRKALEQVWYTGRMHGETVAATICGSPLAYRPGPWFNSAKFFDVEYQVYGVVPPRLKEEKEQLYWQHPEKEHAIRIIWDKETQVVEGFSLLGIRYRHEVCDRWISNGTTIEEVLPRLGEANFDPEFHKRFEEEIIRKWEEQSGKQIQRVRKKSFWRWFK